jgi:hypothetical protein
MKSLAVMLLAAALSTAAFAEPPSPSAKDEMARIAQLPHRV